MNVYQIVGIILLVTCVTVAVWGLWPRKIYGIVSIISGNGFGQSRKLIGVDGFTLTVDHEWDDPKPDSTSVFAIRES